MLMTNKKFNIVAIGIGIVLLIILFNIFYIYRRNENSKILFNEGDFRNTTWVSDNARLSFDNSHVTFTIADDKKIDANYTFNNRTGEIKNDDAEFYLRSINNYSIIVWYNNAEYNLEKEVIAR